MRHLTCALALALPAALGCSEAMLSRIAYRSHDAFTDASYEQYERRRDDGPLVKADVLATLGPPIHVIGQEEGDVFVYRRLASDTTILHLNPSFISYFGPMPPIPLYFGSSTIGRNDILMVFFDSEGRLRADGALFEIDGRRSRDP